MPARLYFDNAATSYPKPETVYAALDRYHREIGVAAGRGAYAQAVEVTRVLQRCRQRATSLLNAESPDRMIFTFNATDGLNLSLSGLLRPGDHVITSQIEHNSVLRPLRTLADTRGIEVDYVPVDGAGQIDPEEFRRRLKPSTRLLALVQASNVTGTLQPIDEVGRIAREAGVLFLVDAAQSAGHVPIDLATCPIDLLACAGHKGLLGPLGTGLLYVRPGVETHLASFRQGGTGSRSEDDRQPASLPDKYESGNHNVPGLVGLEAGLAWIQSRGIESLRQHEQQLVQQFVEGVDRLPGIRRYGPASVTDQVGVVSLTFEAYEPQIAAGILDDSFGIQVRAGLHCAPGVHRALGTLETGGTVRFSFGPFTTGEDVGMAVEALSAMAGG
jgi:cysteine desulfurase family protein